MDRKEKILKFICSKEYVPMKFYEMASVLSVPKKDFGKLGRILDSLAAEGKIEKSKGGKYYPVQEEREITGIFSDSGRGFGFLRPDNQEIEDVFIPPEGVGTAMHGDRVAVLASSRGEGKIVKILQRVNETVVGTVDKNKRTVFVLPDEKKIGQDIYISGKIPSKLKSGMKVVVEIRKWPKGKKCAEGVIQEVLGYPAEKGVDVLSVIRRMGIRDHFPKAVLKEAKALAEVSEQDCKNRLDLRHKLIFTIDGEDAKDLDDAVSLSKIKGGYKLGVHIADVSHYVRRDSALDQEALRRGTSVYFADRVVPMLPEALSNGICSLHPHVDRLTVSVFMYINEKGDVTRYKISKSVINSSYRMTYRNVQKILDGDKEMRKTYKEILSTVRNMKNLAVLLQQKRQRRGSVNFDFPEAKIVLDENGRAVDVHKREDLFSNHIIEEFMLICNETVARHMQDREMPCVYRIHEKPDQQKIENFKKMVGIMGYSFDFRNLTSKAFQKFLEKVKGKPEEQMFGMLVLRSFMKARYSEVNTGHFGLAAKYYCHFTSPIRRYPDLMVHRMLKKSLKGEISQKKKALYENLVAEAARISSECEVNAQEAERTVEDMKKAEYMQQFVGKELEGRISGVTHFGIFVSFDNTAEGLIRYGDIPGRYFVYHEDSISASEEGTNHVFRLGDRLKVRLVRSDPLTGEIDLAFA